MYVCHSRVNASFWGHGSQVIPRSVPTCSEEAASGRIERCCTSSRGVDTGVLLSEAKHGWVACLNSSAALIRVTKHV